MLSLQLHAICNGQKRNFFCSVSQKLARWRKPETIQQRLNNSDAIYCFSCLIGRLTLDVIEIKKFPDWFSDKATEDTDSRSGNLLSSAIMNLQIYEFHISLWIYIQENIGVVCWRCMAQSEEYFLPIKPLIIAHGKQESSGMIAKILARSTGRTLANQK